jgi:heme A synthase
MAGARDSAQGPQPTPPLQIQVPGSGIRYAFEKLYASQAEEDASFSIPYTSALGATLGQVVALVGTALFWVGIVFALRREGPLSGRAAIALAVLGLIVLLAPVGYLETNLTPPLVLSLMALLAAAAFYGRERWGRWISRPTLET